MPPNPNASDPAGDPPVEITHADADAIDAVVDLWVDLAAQQRTHGSHVRAEPNRAAIREVLTAHAVGDGLLVARTGDEVVGFASFTVEGGTLDLDATRGLLSNLYVRPDARDAGIGTALLEAVETALADRGVDLVTLEAMAANEAARRFYRRRGYESYRVAMERRLDAGGENDTHTKDDG